MMDQRKYSNLKIRQHDTVQQYASMDVHYESDLGLAWLSMNAKPVPCFTPILS